MNPILMKLIEVLVGVLGAMAIAAIQKLSEKRVRDRLASLALGHIKNLMSADLGDAEKRKAAFEAIRRDCEIVGLEASDWLINWTIETVVGKLKSEKV